MTDPDKAIKEAQRAEVRANFIESIREMSDIADTCGESVASCVLITLMAALRSRREEFLLLHCIEYMKQQEPNCAQTPNLVALARKLKPLL
jgi:hypothetical protein